MKKNINLLIAQIQSASSTQRPLKMTCKNALEFTNKIFVHQDDLNRPSNAQSYVSNEMKQFRTRKINKEIEAIADNIKKQKIKVANVEKMQRKLSKLQLKFDFLQLQDVVQSLKLFNRQDLDRLRPKLIKLQMKLSFKIENQQYDTHSQKCYNLFLKELTDIINKSNKIY